jgi:putative RecB family exonuclease
MFDPPEYLSPSSIGLFRDCPQKFKLSYIDKIKEPPTWPLHLGSFVHEVLEHLYMESAENRTHETSKSIATDRWLNHGWASKVETLEVKAGSLVDFKRAAFESITNLWELEDPTETEIDEMEVEVLTNVAGVAMKGYIDRLVFSEDGTAVISDYKTGKIPNPKFKSEDDKFFQLLCYALMLEESMQVLTSRLELLYLTQKAKHERTVTPEHLDIAREVIVRTRKEIESSCETEKFDCNVTVLCNYCHYKKIGICPAHNGKN